MIKNKSLYNSIVTVSAIAIAAASEISPSLNSWMQLVPFPQDVSFHIGNFLNAISNPNI
jgi:cation-transporting ATPase 13A1